MAVDSQVFRPNQIQYTMTKDQKRAVGILSIGTFLEYFDLMLYVHMAVVLNELFFPKTDHHTAQLLTAFTFCTTYVFRPFGALLFGWIGDTIGRKFTIVITTFAMGISCIVMATASTYDEVGIQAAYIMIACRILQGMAAMGEVVGALLYLTELIKRPASFFAVSLIPVFCGLGSVCAIGFAALAISTLGNWRAAFWIGAIVAGIGIAARTTLRETPDFVDASSKLKCINEEQDIKFSEQYHLFLASNKEHNKKSYLSLFLIECMWPICFYFIYLYCSDILQYRLHYSSAQVVYHNLVITVFMVGGNIFKSILCIYFHPMRSFRVLLYISLVLYCITPFWLDSMTSGFELGILQVLMIVLVPDIKIISSTVYLYFPVLKRFKATAFLYALSRAVTYVITSFGIVYLVNWFGNFGIFLALFIGTIGALYGFNHFWKLEKTTGNLDIFTKCLFTKASVGGF